MNFVVANNTADSLAQSAVTALTVHVESAVMKNSINIHKHLIIRAEVNNPPTDTTMLEQWLREFIDFINQILVI